MVNQVSVDLVIADTVKPRLKPIMEREVVYAYTGKKHGLGHG